MRVGDTIAGYEIVAKLKSGGMAALYLGRRQGAAGFAKHVAIKVVHDHLADDEGFVKMFLDEARITARIEHPNVVHVHDLGFANDHYFLVMEYVPSVSLTQLMRAVAKLGRRLSPEVATWIAMQIAAGLHSAHETTDEEGHPLHIVHRDVSPKNVLLAYKGYVKVIDFGIAKAVGRATKTAGGMLKGTFRYMSPEQARGRELDHRSDLYTLGIVLWEMLVMRRLFEADNDLALLDMVREPEVVPPGRLISMPTRLDRVVMKALSKDPNDRPESCDEMRMMLASAMPDALRVTAKQVAELIGASMAEKINVDENPSVASALGKPVTVQVPARVLEKMTRTPEEILVDGAAALQPNPIIVTPTGQMADPHSGIVPTMVTPTPSHPGLEDAKTIEREPDRHPDVEIDLVETIPVPAKPRSPMPLIAGIATAVFLLGGGAIWLATGGSDVEAAQPPAIEGAAIEDEPSERRLAIAQPDEPVEAPMERPAVEEPVEAPPVEAPPVDAPPVEAPPVEAPPVEEPPVEAPPVEEPNAPVEEQEAVAVTPMRATGIRSMRAGMRNDMRAGMRNDMRRRSAMSDDPLVVGW